MVLVLFRLTYPLGMTLPRLTHVATNGSIPSFSRLCSIPLCIGTMSTPATRPSKDAQAVSVSASLPQ